METGFHGQNNAIENLTIMSSLHLLQFEILNA